MTLLVKCYLVLLVTLVVSEVSLGRNIGRALPSSAPIGHSPFQRIDRHAPRPRPSRDQSQEELYPPEASSEQPLDGEGYDEHFIEYVPEGGPDGGDTSVYEEVIDDSEYSEDGGSRTDAEATLSLIEKLSQNYQHRYVNPLGEGDKLSVGLAYLCARFDEDEHVLTSRVWERMSWRDSRLQWEPSEYNDISELQIESWYIWTPDITLYNSVESNHREWVNAVVDSTGLVTYVPPATYKTVCRPEGDNSHSCKLQFGSWTYDSETLPIEVDDQAFDTRLYNYDCPYVIESYQVGVTNNEYEGFESEYTTIDVDFTIQPNDYTRRRH